LWLGHEHVETTLIYLEATLAMKEKALAKTIPPDGTPGRYKPGDRLLAFLNSLFGNETQNAQVLRETASKNGTARSIMAAQQRHPVMVVGAVVMCSAKVSMNAALLGDRNSLLSRHEVLLFLPRNLSEEQMCR
jgi:hypothetical protein